MSCSGKKKIQSDCTRKKISYIKKKKSNEKLFYYDSKSIIKTKSICPCPAIKTLCNRDTQLHSYVFLLCVC